MNKQQIIKELKNSGAKYVVTSISAESCALEIALQDIENADEFLLDGFWWEKRTTGLDKEDY